MGLGEWFTTPARKRTGDKTLAHKAARKGIKEPVQRRLARGKSTMAQWQQYLEMNPNPRRPEKGCVCGHKRVHPQCIADEMASDD